MDIGPLSVTSYVAGNDGADGGTELVEEESG